MQDDAGFEPGSGDLAMVCRTPQFFQYFSPPELHEFAIQHVIMLNVSCSSRTDST